MTYQGAINKAKKHAMKQQDVSVIELGRDYSVCNTDSVEELVEDGYNYICSFRFNQEAWDNNMEEWHRKPVIKYNINKLNL